MCVHLLATDRSAATLLEVVERIGIHLVNAICIHAHDFWCPVVIVTVIVIATAFVIRMPPQVREDEC